MPARPTSHRRPNPKGRRVLPPPAGISLEALACNCRYFCSPYHRTMPGPCGKPVYRPGKSKCPEELQRDPDRVQSWLEDAIRDGSFGEFEGGFPRLIWRRVGDTIFEARQGTPGSGVYHGYPLESFQFVEGLS